MANHQRNYYSNPAFSQQSEFYNGGNSKRIIRQSPVGAQENYQETYVDEEEQEFYEEMLVDDNTGVVKEKKVLVVSSSPGNQLDGPSSNGPKSRYEYIQMQEQYSGNRYIVQNVPQKSNMQQHRYAIIETSNNDFRDLSPPRRSNNNNNTLSRSNSVNNHHRYEYIQDDYSPSRKIHQQPQINTTRYEYIQCDPKVKASTSPNRRVPAIRGNPIATQKLHELLSTPKKSPMRSHQVSPTARDPFLTSTPTRKPSRVQQKLNYNNTAVVAPICASPIQGVYSETTFTHQKSESWVNIGPNKRTAGQLTLALAAFMMMLCGGVTSGLCFYMVSIMGRLYFLDFGIVAGFTCLVLGVLGFRTRNCYWLPNRNYISGYILLSVFSLLMCAGLLILLVLHPKPGTPLADMTSGAVCGISVLSLILASVGVMTSYCCQYPPPDNRVQHSVPGFTV